MTAYETMLRQRINKIGYNLKLKYINGKYCIKGANQWCNTLEDVEKWIVSKENEIEKERKEYEAELEKYKPLVNYPVYDKWCVECIIDTIKRYGIKNGKDELKNYVFNLAEYDESMGYVSCSEFVLGRINEDRHYKESMLDIVQTDFFSAYYEKYLELNKNITDNDILMDLVSEGTETADDLLYRALDEIGIEGLKDVVLQITGIDLRE